jgi:cyclopropane fatty-acyl-phospholipid synthase-like methyltransferase
MLDLAGCGRLLDLAGGPGTYAVLLAQAHPSLTCVTVDLPAVSAVATELVREAGLSQRVLCQAGDYHTDDYEAGAFDAVTIFGALHQESPQQIISILKRARAALKPGGRIFILDMMTDATHTRPIFSALFAVNMALTTRNGWVFSDVELKGWLAEAGFVAGETRLAPPPMPHWLVCGTAR